MLYCHMFVSFQLSCLHLSFFHELHLQSYLLYFTCHIAATMIKFIIYNVQKLSPWLCRQVTMVKPVIKAIKAAGVGLNESSDCLCCHK